MSSLAPGLAVGLGGSVPGGPGGNGLGPGDLVEYGVPGGGGEGGAGGNFSLIFRAGLLIFRFSATLTSRLDAVLAVGPGRLRPVDPDGGGHDPGGPGDCVALWLLSSDRESSLVMLISHNKVSSWKLEEASKYPCNLGWGEPDFSDCEGCSSEGGSGGPVGLGCSNRDSFCEGGVRVGFGKYPSVRDRGSKNCIGGFRGSPVLGEASPRVLEVSGAKGGGVEICVTGEGCCSSGQLLGSSSAGVSLSNTKCVAGGEGDLSRVGIRGEGDCSSRLLCDPSAAGAYGHISRVLQVLP